MEKAKIVVVYGADMSKAQRERLSRLGDVTFNDVLPKNGEEYLEMVKGADVICSTATGLQDVYGELKDVFVTVSFVSVAFLDLEVMKQNNVSVANSPGINRHAVTEWITYMCIEASRHFRDFVDQTENLRLAGVLPDPEPGLARRNITILGNGNVAKQSARVLSALDANVFHFRRGDDLYASVKDADIVIDTLGSNQETERLLNKKYFDAMKQGSVFMSIARGEITDEEALIAALDSEHLKHAYTDCGAILGADTDDIYYKKLLAHPKITATPHVAFNSQMSMILGNDVMIDNVEAWLSGKPQNILNP